MTEWEFKIEMKSRGWNADEIEEFVERSQGEISMPLEYWVRDKPKVRTYRLNSEGFIIDDDA